jgi:hypothetical protein
MEPEIRFYIQKKIVNVSNEFGKKFLKQRFKVKMINVLHVIVLHSMINEMCM